VFASALDEHFDRPFSVLEGGSGPGHLAVVVMRQCRVSG
jgi:hypothetical protein